MGITLVLNERLEERLRDAAARQGTTAENYALHVLEDALPGAPEDAAVALIQSWIGQGDVEEQRETGDHLVRVLDEVTPSPRKLFP